MVYRTLGRTGIRVSEIGLGCEHLQGKDYNTVKAVIDAAIDSEMNMMDVFMSEPQIRADIGKAIRGKREKVLLQGHIGSTWQNGQYAKSRSFKDCNLFFEDLRKRLQTDYIDVGMLHFIDAEDDYTYVFQSEIIDYALKLKQEGTIRAIGVSSHNPVVSKKMVESGLIDVLMFSLNPAYDILPEDMSIPLGGASAKDMLKEDGVNEISAARTVLYQTCEQMGTAITVMKCYLGGMLLTEALSPFGFTLSTNQCIHYALTRPSVSSVLIGCTTPKQIQEAMQYETATQAEKDFSDILSGKLKHTAKGRCVYCNHCLPCPSNIDIAQVNKYFDLAVTENSTSFVENNTSPIKNGIPSIGSNSPPATVAAHYEALGAHASDCISCGSCEARCPFGVPVIKKMNQAKEIFGK